MDMLPWPSIDECHGHLLGSAHGLRLLIFGWFDGGEQTHS